MRIVVSKKLRHFHGFRAVAKKLAIQKWKPEVHRGVIDAGRKTRTQVRRALRHQMAVAGGHYQRYIVQNTKSRNSQVDLSYTIFSYDKGDYITTYKGLRALSTKGKAARRFNSGRLPLNQGFVRSSVWNAPRTFQRSFATSGGYFAWIPSDTPRKKNPKTGSYMPRSLWTRDSRYWQPRDEQGRFSETGAKRKFKVRKLYGPAINKELVLDESIKVFNEKGPQFLIEATNKRIARLLKY